MKEKFKKIILFFANPRFLLCFGLGWIITNGWAYAFVGIGAVADIGWMTAVGTAYLAFLWLPITPEKIITIGISILLLKWLFPNDKKTLKILIDLKNKVKDAIKSKRKGKKEQSPNESALTKNKADTSSSDKPDAEASGNVSQSDKHKDNETNI